MIDELKRTVLGLGAVAVVLSTASCRKREVAAEEGPPPVVATELTSNQLAGLPGEVYRSQAESPVCWQLWSKESFERARAAQRMVLAVIALPQYGGFQKVLGELQANPTLVATINDNYVPVLVDGDAAREMGLLTAELAAEIRRPVQLPMFVWLTPDRNPVAWIPVPGGDNGKVCELFDKSHAMVIESWGSKRDYVNDNSAMDNANRRERMKTRRNVDIASKEPAEDVVRSIRQLTSLYDPVSRSFDEAGGLFPTGGIATLSSAALCQSLPAEVRARCLRTVRELMIDLLPSPMFDPLDGGLYAARRGGDWSLPAFERDANRQALAVVALCLTYQATGNEAVLERAMGVLAFLESHYATSDGLFALGAGVATPIRDSLWTLEEVKAVLPAEDVSWWIAATRMHGLGNLPSEVDPKRDFFRCNSFGMSESVPQIAARLGLSPEEFKPRYQAACKRLLEARQARTPGRRKDQQAHAPTTFRMVSAYAAAFTVTGDESYRDRAVALLNKARKTFSDGRELWQYSQRTIPPVSVGRAFLYGLALQACLDVCDVTGDESSLSWADDLATTAAELFAKDGFLKECPDSAEVLDLPVTDLAMLFDESSAGLISANESRMEVRGRPLLESFTAQAIALPLVTLKAPIMHTDLIVATLARLHAPTVVVGGEVPAELNTAVARLPLRVVNRRPATAKDGVPATAVKILRQDGSAQLVETLESFQQALLPTP